MRHIQAAEAYCEPSVRKLTVSYHRWPCASGRSATACDSTNLTEWSRWSPWRIWRLAGELRRATWGDAMYTVWLAWLVAALLAGQPGVRPESNGSQTPPPPPPSLSTFQVGTLLGRTLGGSGRTHWAAPGEHEDDGACDGCDGGLLVPHRGDGG